MTDKFEKKCAVCGDRAAGYNFNVQSCVSCKAFFRRNAIKSKQLKCAFNEQCQLNPVTRKFCSKCRLNKCLDAGMKKELILTEEEKQIRKNKVLEKRKLNNEFKVVVDSTAQNSCDSLGNNLNIDQFMIDILRNDSLGEQDIAAQVKELEYSNEEESEDDISPEVYRKCLELDFVVMPVIRPMTDYKNNFNEMEGNRLTELFSALNIMKCSLGEVTAKADNWLDALTAVADDFEVMIEKLVHSSKRLTFFNEICNDDQIALVKYGAIEVSCVRQVMGYDCQTQNMIVKGENATDFILVNLKAIEEQTVYLYEANKNFYRRIGKEWDSDVVILDLLTAIVFFNPDRPKLRHREPIRYLQLRYRSECVATTKFLRLMNTMKYLHDLYLKHIQLYEESANSPMTPSDCHCGGILDEVYTV